MSKIKNGGLDQYGAGPFEQQQFGTAGVEWVNMPLIFFLHALAVLSYTRSTFLTACPCVDLPNDNVTKMVLTGIEESFFCRIIKRLIGEKLASDAAYKDLVNNKTCFDVMRRRRRAACSGTVNYARRPYVKFLTQCRKKTKKVLYTLKALKYLQTRRFSSVSILIFKKKLGYRTDSARCG